MPHTPAGPTGSASPIPLFELASQHQALRWEIENAVRQVLESTEYIGGTAVKRFEEHLGRYCQAYAVAVSSGTDAILAALMALRIGPGDKVITTPFTFFATAGGITRVGARPVFVDINPATFLLEAGAVSAAVDSTTRAVLPVHLFGQMCDMRSLAQIASRHSLAIVEDAAQCIGAHDNQGQGIAQLSRAACLSFYPTKNLGAAGDAGALLTRDAALADIFRQIRQHGETSRYHHAFVGGNFRLDAIQCAVLDVKLKHLSIWNQRRRAIAAYYTQRLRGSDVLPPREISGTFHVYHQYVIRAPQRDRLREHLRQKGIGTAIYYPRPLHLQECFSNLGYKQGAFPNAEQVCREALALPMFPELTDAQMERVAEEILAFHGGKKIAASG
jgi:dTDP-4-amino-4,6-dideoxygalactose transaminase